MNRAITLALTVALIGGLAMVGFAGSAAAQPDVEIDAFNPEVDNEQEANANTTIETSQSNSNSQTQTAWSFSSSGTSYATTVAEQGQDVSQNNVNVVEDVTTIAENEADNEAENDIEISLGLGNNG